MHVLVTGGAGFIGSTVVDRLLRDIPGVSVRVLDDLSTGNRSNLAQAEVELLVGSVTDPDAVRAATAGVDAVLHLAAIGSVPLSLDDPARCHAVNVTGTIEVLEAARAVGAQVVFASSSAVYGSNPAAPIGERDWTAPLSPYAASKLAAESYLLSYRHSYGLPGLALRFFNVYGPRQSADHPYAAVIPKFLDAGLRGRPLPIHGDGGQTRDFVAVDTVAQVLCRAVVERTSHPRPVNLAGGSSISLLDLVDELAAVLGQRPAVDHQPARAGDVRHSLADVGQLRELFPGLTTVPLRDGLARTAAWFRSQGVGAGSAR
ncbi:MAG: NAD-dependent epimerase/dehydratase family protein [Micropruina sp.]|uniref:NAD-dependent epimerase/dehydratase family protein n=1 Tax=Micropruina sp. TaxID=2737536 RepID=UPI0039E63A96